MVEQGKNTLTEQNIKLICITFDVDEDWLRHGRGRMFGLISPHDVLHRLMTEELLQHFNKMSPSSQKFMIDMARNLLAKEEK
jgi:hypothetical protein